MVSSATTETVYDLLREMVRRLVEHETSEEAAREFGIRLTEFISNAEMRERDIARYFRDR